MIKRDEFDDIKLVLPPAAEAETLPPRIKLQATIGIERAILPLFFIGIFVFMAVVFLSGGKNGNGLIQSERSLLIGLGIGGAFWLIAALIWVFVDDYYILDRYTRQVLLHTGLRFSGTEFPFLENHQLAAIGLDCSPTRSKCGQIGWTYTPVLLTRTEEKIKLACLCTGMDCKELRAYNQKVRQWASALQCYWVECPPNQVFDAQHYFDKFNNKPIPG